MKSLSRIIKNGNGNGNGTVLGTPPPLLQLSNPSNGHGESPDLFYNDSSIKPFSWNQFSSSLDVDLQQPKENNGKNGKEEKEKQWEKMKEEAREWSRQCIQEAQAKAEAIAQEAYQKGFTAGEQDGREAVREKLDPLFQLLDQLVKDAESLRRQIWKQSEKDLVTLSLALAKRIIRHEINLDHGVIGKVAEEALQNFAANDKVRIRINPEDYAALITCKDKLLPFSEESKNLTIEEDGTISRGGCLVESSFGQIDARIEKQLEALESALGEAVRGPGAEPK